MKLSNNLFLFIIALSSCLIAQSKEDLALDYERAIKLTNANEALEIYQAIINTNEDSDYVWLSKLKKAEMFYAKGSYITSSNLLKEYCEMLDGGANIDIYCTVLSAVGQEKITEVRKKDA